MREMELNRCRDDVADEIDKFSVELEASNAAFQACLEEAGKHMQDDKADHPRIIELKKKDGSYSFCRLTQPKHPMQFMYSLATCVL